jgi:hypothetical protein
LEFKENSAENKKRQDLKGIEKTKLNITTI